MARIGFGIGQKFSYQYTESIGEGVRSAETVYAVGCGRAGRRMENRRIKAYNVAKYNKLQYIIEHQRVQYKLI